MKEQVISECKKELAALCASVRAHTGKNGYAECEKHICEAMGKYPHAAEPHNLIGILLEKAGDHTAAMKHFRAARALDPTYQPARQNLDNFGTFFSRGKYAYDESDCPEEKHDEFLTGHGIGHVVKKG